MAIKFFDISSTSSVDRETPTPTNSLSSTDSTISSNESTALKKLLGTGAISEKEETSFQKTFTPKLKQALQDACLAKSADDRKKAFSTIKIQLNLAASESNAGKTAREHILPTLEDRLLDWNRDQHYLASSTLLNPDFEYPEQLEQEHPFGYQGELSNVQILVEGNPPLNPHLAAANKFLKQTYQDLPEETHWDFKPTGQITRHSGWIPISTDPLVATRTFGMMDSNRVRVGSVKLDLSSLGSLNEKEKLICLRYLEEQNPEDLPEHAEELLTNFEKQCDQKLQKMHEELMQFDDNPESHPAQRCAD